MTNKSALPTPPTGFVHHQKLFKQINLSGWKLFVFANLLALLPFGFGLLALWVPYQLYLAAGAPWAWLPTTTLTLWQSLLFGGLFFVGSMLLHEWLHGFAMSLLGHRPIYYFRHLVLYAGLQPGDYLTRNHYLIMTLTPLVLMSLSGFVVLFILPPAFGKLLLIVLLLNTAASLGDLMVAYNVYKAPKTAVFNDNHGIQMYLPK